MTVADLVELVERPAWMEHAACRGMDVNLFYPDHQINPRHIHAICDPCPTREACLAYALDRKDQHGWWGSKSPKQRRRGRQPGRPKKAA